MNDDFPNGFRIQRVKLPAAPWLADLPAEDIAKYFHGNLAAAKDLLQESYDKRYTPSSFISEENYGFSVSLRMAIGRQKPQGESFLKEAMAAGADLMLKGAYTQSRIRQMIFGGATRHIIMEAKIPVVMSR